MPNEKLNSLLSAYSTKPIVATEENTGLIALSAAQGISTEEYQSIVDSNKGWFSQDLTHDIDGSASTYFRTSDQLATEQEYYQNNWEKAGAGILRTGNKFLTEVAKLPGVAAGMLESTFTDKSIGESLDNWWVNGLQEWENYANEDILKVHVPQSVREGGLWANLSSASFWATEGADGVGFLTSMLVPGNVLKLAKLGQRGVNLLNAGNEFLAMSKGLTKGLSKTQSLRMAAGAEKLGIRAAENIDNVTAATVNATIEAAAEAKETFDNSMQAQTQKYLKDNGLEEGTPLPMDVEEAFRMAAGEASSSVFKWNAALLLGPNLLDQRLLFGAFGARKTGLSKLFKEGVLGDFTSQTLKQSAKNYVGEGLLGIVKEGFFEEGSQFAVSEYFKNKSVKGKEDDKGFFESGANNFYGIVNTYIDNIDNVDMQKAISLGSVLGGGMSVIGEVKTSRYQDKVGRELHSQLKNNLVNRLNSTINEAIVYNDKGEMEMENGKPKMDMEKVLNLFKQNDNQMTLSKLADIAAISGNKEDYHLFQSVIDFNYFQPFFQQGEEGIAILKQHIQNQLSESEAKKLNQESLLDLTNTTEVQRTAQLLTKVDEFYKIYDNITNRHIFDMPKLEGGKKSDKAEFSNLILAKKLEKVILKDQLSRITLDLKNSVFNLASKNILDPTTKEVIKQDPNNTFSDEYTLLPDLSESDQKELDLIGSKEKQYSEVYKKIKEDNDLLYNKKELATEYSLWLAAKEAKKAEEEIKDTTNEQLKSKLVKDLADAGYKMDTEHVLDPEKKSKMTAEELQPYIGDDKFFTFELNGKEYEASSFRDPATGKVRRVYINAFDRKVVGDFDYEFLRKNRGIRIINKQEAADKRKLAKLRKSKIAKLRAFRDVFNNLNKDFIENEDVFKKLYNKRNEIREEIEVYNAWIKSITYESGMAFRNKSEEKTQILEEIKRLEKVLEDLDQQIEDLNNIYGSVTEQFDMLSQIKEQFEIYKEDTVFKTEQKDVLLSEFALEIKRQIDNELEQLVNEEADLNEMLITAEQAVAKAEQELNDANNLRAEVEIIFEDLKRVANINEIVKLLLTSDFKNSEAFKMLTDKYKPLGFIANEVEKLRDSTITDEQYLRVVTVTNNLLSDIYLQKGTQPSFAGVMGLQDFLNDLRKSLVNIRKSPEGVAKFPLGIELQYYMDNYYSIPTKIADRLVSSKQNLLNSANRYYENAIGKKYTFDKKEGTKIAELTQTETVLTKLMRDLYVGYRKYLNRTPYQQISVNNKAPEEQDPTVYPEDLKDKDGKIINPASFLSDHVFRNIGLDIEYEKDKDDENYGKTVYPKDNEGLPKLNENDENYRRLAAYINKHPDLPYTHNARFFIARTDAEGKTSINLGNGESSAELLALYESIPESGRKNGDVSIGFYLVDKDGNVANQEYNGRTAPVLGFIPRKITDESGRLRINNATAISVLTNFDIRDKDKFKYINDYALTNDDGVYTFAAVKKDYVEGKEIESPSNVTVEVVDGKAVITARFVDFIPAEGNVKITSEDAAKKIAQLLKENTKYSLSRAGKMVQAIMMDSDIKYHKFIKLTNVKSKLIENESVIERFGQVTIEELVEKATAIFVGTDGRPGLYQTSVIEPLIKHIETDNNAAFVGINMLTRGIPLVQYEVDDKGEPMFNRPISNKVTKVFNIKVEGQKIKGGELEIIDATNTKDLGSTPGKVVLRLKNDKGNFTGEVVPLQQRTLDSNELLTALFIMSNANEPGMETPEFGTTKDGKSKFFLSFEATKDKRVSIAKMRMLPFNQESTVSAISALIYWGQHNQNKFYTNSQGVAVPIKSSKVGEIFSHEGKIHFKKKLDDSTWIDTSVEIEAVKNALATNDPLNNPGISDLVAFLADKRVNVNKQLLTDDSSMYFHPMVTKTAEGYEFGFTPYDNYQSFLIKKVVTTSAPVKENFPKFANRMIVFKSENRVKPRLSDKFVSTKEEIGPKEKKKAISTKNAAAAPAAPVANAEKKTGTDLLFGTMTKEQRDEASANFASLLEQNSGPVDLQAFIMNNLVGKSSKETAAENQLSAESKSLASMFGQRQQAAPEAPPSTRPKELFPDVNTSGASITGDPKVDGTINDQKEFC